MSNSIIIIIIIMVWLENGSISPEMKFFPLAVPMIVVNSSAGNHFNVVTIPNDYGYYNTADYDRNSKKFRSALLEKFKINTDKYFYPWVYVDEKLIKDVYPPYIDRGFSGLGEFIQYNVNRIYEGTRNLNRLLQSLIIDMKVVDYPLDLWSFTELGRSV